MTIDLFVKKTKKEQLLDFIRARHFITSHKIVAWGLNNYHIRADRDKRDLVAAGHIRRLPDQEKYFRGYKGKDAVYEYMKG